MLPMARVLRLLVLGVCGAALLMSVGCREPLFPDRAPRSQYERYDALRGEAAPRYEQQRGRGPGPRQPALRERLRPHDGY